MVNYHYFLFNQLCTGGNIIKKNYYKKKYILDGMGKSNQAIKTFFDQHQIAYVAYDDADKEKKKDIKIDDYDYLIKSPGVPLSQQLVLDALNHHIPVISDLELFYLLKPNQKYVSVTGSNGKTTITYFIHQLLDMLGIKHHLGGNIGIPLFSFIDQVSNNDLILIEASSYMLEAVTKFCPLIHVISNIYQHHLDHHLCFQTYFDAKVKPLDGGNKVCCIYPASCSPIKTRIDKNGCLGVSFSQGTAKGDINVDDCLLNIDQKAYYLEKLTNFSKIDQLNILISLEVINYLKQVYPKQICLEAVFDKIDQLKKYPFREQLIVNNAKALIINDSKATNYYATKAATLILKDKYPNDHFYKILIAGGKKQNYLKNSFSFVSFFDEINLYGENRYQLRNLVGEYTKNNVYETLEEVIKDLDLRMQKKISNSKKLLILFSPMAASHDQYQSYVERGKHFNELINSYHDFL